MRELVQRLGGRGLLATAAALALAALVSGAAAASNGKGKGDDRLQRIDHIVVIYEENHSFDNLYGGWEGVNGVSNADPAHTIQVDQFGNPYSCLFQNDANLTSPPSSTVCSGVTPRGVAFNSHFRNAPFTIDDYIKPDFITCPPTTNAFAFPNGILNPGINPATGSRFARPGGCTRDIVHKFYQEIYQLNGGAQNRYATGSDAGGLVMGVYDTRQLPIYRYLHGGGHPHYAIADNFFQAAFGGSFLNHQWLIAAATPVYPGAPATFHSVLDSAGFNHNNYPLYNPLAGATYRDGDLTVDCTSPVKPAGACGDFAVNTMQPSYLAEGDVRRRARAAVESDDRRPPVGAGDRLGLVRGRLGQRGRQHHGPRLDERAGPHVRRSEPRSGELGVSACARTSSSSTTISRSTTTRTTRPERPAAAHLQDEAGVRPCCADVGQELQPEAGQLHQAGRRGERAPGLRERAGRQRPSRRPPAGDREQRLREGHDGDRHVRRVRRSVGSRAAARSGRKAAGRTTSWGPGTRIPALIVSPFLRGN